MSTPIVQVRDLGKSFLKRKQQVQALSDIHLAIHAGEIVTLLGHNGAGKSTLLKVLATLVTPDCGSAEIEGISIAQAHQVRQRIGWLTPEERSFYWRLTGRQNLRFFAALLNLSKAQREQRLEQLIEQLGLADFIDRRFDRYSAGMRQKLALARSLLHQPALLLLDEPTRSIDLESKERLRDTLKDLVATGNHTVILVTHEHAYARSLSDRLVILNNGRIDRIDHRQDAHAIGSARYRITVSILSEVEHMRFARLPSVSAIEQQADQQQSVIVTRDLDGILPTLVQHGLHLIDITRSEGSLK